MKRLKKAILYILLFGQIAVISGCGTITRSESTSNTYRGFDMDKSIVSNAYWWMFSLGVYPIFSIVSMPFDLIFDTALYPYDIYQEKKLQEAINNRKLLSKDTEIMPYQKE